MSLIKFEGEQDTYIKSLRLLCHKIPDFVERLENTLQEKQLNWFQADVHEMKGLLLSIGAVELAARAQRLEQASAQNELSFCEEHAPGFLEDLTDLNQELVQLLENPE